MIFTRIYKVIQRWFQAAYYHETKLNMDFKQKIWVISFKKACFFFPLLAYGKVFVYVFCFNLFIFLMLIFVRICINTIWNWRNKLYLDKPKEKPENHYMNWM